MTEEEEAADYQRRVDNSQKRANTVANELRIIAEWLSAYTGGVARVDVTGFVDELLDGFQQADPDFDFTDSVRKEAAFAILRSCKDPLTILEDIKLMLTRI
jgi:hypothetical protein